MDHLNVKNTKNCWDNWFTILRCTQMRYCVEKLDMFRWTLYLIEVKKNIMLSYYFLYIFWPSCGSLRKMLVGCCLVLSVIESIRSFQASSRSSASTIVQRLLLHLMSGIRIIEISHCSIIILILFGILCAILVDSRLSRSGK